MTNKHDVYVFFEKEFPLYTEVKAFGAPACSPRSRMFQEIWAFQNFLVNHAKAMTWEEILLLLTSRMEEEEKNKGMPMEWWHDEMKDAAVRAGFVDWARKHPKEIF